MNIVSIIPARGGSKGIPKKNIIDLCGKPLIAYSIEASLSSRYVTKTIVSTDSQEIADVSRKFGAEVIMRPDDLSTDTAGSLGVFKHVVEELEKQNYDVDVVLVLQPTSPNRSNEDINLAFKQFFDSKKEILVSVCKLKQNPNWLLDITNGNLEFFKENDFSSIRRQDLENNNDLFYLNGSIYIYKKDLMMNSEKFVWSKQVEPFIMSKEKSIDIDEPLDLEIAKVVMMHKSKK